MDREPCLAILTPAAAATKELAVLHVEGGQPAPVPQVSVSRSASGFMQRDA